MAVAEKYMKEAGFASGKYEGDEELLMVTANVDPGKAQAEVAKAQLEKLGFKIRLRTVPQDAVYTEWCQQPAKKVAVCGSAGWFKDFNDPQSMLEPTFKGSNYSPEGGNNNLAPAQRSERSTRPWTTPRCSRATSATRPGVRSTR